MPASFAANGSTIEKLGFDETTAPPWAMLPVHGTKKVVLKDGSGLSLTLRNPADKNSIRFSEEAPTNEGRIIILSGGGNPKTILLDARNSSGVTQASLEITIKAQLRLATFIGFIFDTKVFKAVRGLTSALHDMDVANRIMLPQTNVVMFRKDSGAVNVPFEIPRGMPADFPSFHAPLNWDRPGPGMLLCTSSRPLGPEGCLPEDTQGPRPFIAPGVQISEADFQALRSTQMLANIVNRINSTFDYNIFCVRNLDAGSSGIAANTAAFTPIAANAVEINLCFYPDSANGLGLAHELGHFLLRSSPLKGVGRHSTRRGDLMAGSSVDQGLTIPKDQSNVMNPSGFP
jgi:hypothetical protein